MPFRYVCLAIFVMALWGGNFVAIKVALQDFPPLLFSVLRFTFTVFPMIFLVGKREVSWAIIIGIGLTLGTMKFTALFIGMDIGVTAGIASLVLQTQVFFTVILALLLLSEKPSALDWLGLLIAFLGIGIIAWDMPGAQSQLGLGLVILAGSLWAIANFIMKKAAGANMLRLIVYMSLIPIVPMAVLSWTFEGPDRIYLALSGMTFSGIGALAYVVITGTLFGFAVWGNLLSRYPAAKVAPFTLLVPIFGMSSSALLLGEKFSHTQLVGAGAVMVGLVLINGGGIIKAGQGLNRFARLKH